METGTDLLELHSIGTLRGNPKTDRELGATRDDMVQVIETKINHFPGYKTVSSFYVGKALTETRLVAEDLFLKTKRDQFLAVLAREDNPAGALLFRRSKLRRHDDRLRARGLGRPPRRDSNRLRAPLRDSSGRGPGRHEG